MVEADERMEGVHAFDYSTASPSCIYSSISTALRTISRPAQFLLTPPVSGTAAPVVVDVVERALITPGTQHTTTSTGDIPSVETDKCPVSSTVPASIASKYTTSMLDLLHGYPLYEPASEAVSADCSKKGIRVGDVGLITEDGGFDFLFNVCSPRHESINPTKLPEGFETIQHPQVVDRTCFPRGTHLCSRGVTQSRTSSDACQCPLPHGAILELPLGATLFETKNKTIFRDLATRHAEKWYKYIRLLRGRDAANGSLYLVTGAIKCRDWGISVLERSSVPQGFVPGMAPRRGQDASRTRTYGWNRSSAAQTKVGQPPAGKDTLDGADLSQCVFIRGYKIMLQHDVWDKLFRSDSSNHVSFIRSSDQYNILNQYSTPDAPSLSTSRPRQGGSLVTIQEAFRSDCPIHPSDLVNAALLKTEPLARVALTHDDQWCTLSSTNSSNPRHTKSDPDAVLSYSTHLDQYSCVSLIRIMSLQTKKDLQDTISSADWDSNTIYICFTTDSRILLKQDLESLRSPEKRAFYCADIEMASVFMESGTPFPLMPTSFCGTRLQPFAVPPKTLLILPAVNSDGISLGQALSHENKVARPPDLLPLVTSANIIPDDSTVSSPPCRQVDYLSHNWQEEDVWRSWRRITTHKNDIADAIRLENASWRTWWKQRNNLKTIAPETLNWFKDADVTWLYGPLHTATDGMAPATPKPDGRPKSSPNRKGKPKRKPILKHRSLGELLASELPSSPFFNHIDSENEDLRSDSQEVLRPGRAEYPNRRIKYDMSRSSPHGGVPLSRTESAEASSISLNSSLEEPRSHIQSYLHNQKKKHISFNTFVEQWIAVEKLPNLEQGRPCSLGQGSDDDDHSIESDSSDTDDDNSWDGRTRHPLLSGSAIADSDSDEDSGSEVEDDGNAFRARPRSNSLADDLLKKLYLESWPTLESKSPLLSPCSTPLTSVSCDTPSTSSTSFPLASRCISPSPGSRRTQEPFAHLATRVPTRRSSNDSIRRPRPRLYSASIYAIRATSNYKPQDSDTSKRSAQLRATIAPMAPAILKTTDGERQKWEDVFVEDDDVDDDFWDRKWGDFNGEGGGKQRDRRRVGDGGTSTVELVYAPPLLVHSRR